MCGIAGFLEHKATTEQTELVERCRRMTDTLIHRGPDASGVWVDANKGIALGHRRLSIIDLSEAGAQPMTSASGRYVLTFNGEIYNFRRLRAELARDDYPFRGHSDTEVILAATEHWGIEQAIERLDGMFAFALWDRHTASLTLARDRAGKKPLFYGWHGTTFLFGSELKALREHTSFSNHLDFDALGQFLQYGWVPQPHSIYRHVRKLPPGSYLHVHPQDTASSPQSYWTAKQVIESSEKHPFTGSYKQGIEQLDTILRDAVADRMVADVDIGALLSGGIDSSMVVALMQSLSEKPVRTFSIGFWEPKYNEAEHAARVAKHLGTEHHELYVTAQQALDTVERLPTMYDEPFADASQIPTFLVCQLARRDVKVVLSGDGGDESFAGYNRYRSCSKHWRLINSLPFSLRQAAARLAHSVGDASWRRCATMHFAPGKKVPKWQSRIGKITRDACNWTARSPQEVLAINVNKCVPVDRFVREARMTPTPLSDPSQWAQVEDPLRAMLHCDYIGCLPDDILVKVDRASMAVSLEARSPLLDRRVLEFAWHLPNDFLIDRKGGKRILKDLLARYVPRELFDRPKWGFSVPVRDWLRGPLRDWGEDLIGEQRLREQGIFDVAATRQAWEQHLCGWRNNSELLWALLMFQAWWQNNAEH